MSFNDRINELQLVAQQNLDRNAEIALEEIKSMITFA